MKKVEQANKIYQRLYLHASGALGCPVDVPDPPTVLEDRDLRRLVAVDLNRLLPDRLVQLVVLVVHLEGLISCKK